jgi:hypothetical protein
MADVLINEIHPSPLDGFEWVELFNNSNESISVSRIKLYDQTSKALKINKDVLSPYTYAIATASAVLNNSGDTILLEKDGTIMETITYGAIESGKSYARCDNIWIENVVATYGSSNLCEENTLPTGQPSRTPTSTPSTPVQPFISSPLVTIAPTRKITQSLAAISFNTKHALLHQTAQPSQKISPTITIIQNIKSTQPSPPLPLFAIGVFSLIQCIFLVYLIIKRIRFGAPDNLNITQ